MTETPTATRPTETRTFTGPVVTSFASLILLICGGLVESLTVIGISSVILLSSIAWLWRQDSASVLGIYLPAAASVVLVTAGLYLDGVSLAIAGVVLQGAHVVWRIKF